MLQTANDVLGLAKFSFIWFNISDFKQGVGVVFTPLSIHKKTFQNRLRRKTSVDTSHLAARSNLACLKGLIDEIDTEKLETVSVCLNKLRSAADNDVFNKTVYDELAAKDNAIDTNGFASKTQYNTRKSGLGKRFDNADKRTQDNSVIFKKMDYNAITDTGGKIPWITGSATTVDFNTVENKISNGSGLVKMQKSCNAN